MLLSTCIVLCFFNFVITESEVDNTSRDVLWEKKLHDDLREHYNKNKSPNNNGTNTTVAVRLNLKTFFFDDEEEFLIIYTWMFFSWYDPRLKWDPADYYGIDSTQMRAMTIWVPNLINEDKMDPYVYSILNFYSLKCLVKSSGYVLCIPRVTTTSICRTKLTDWPYDTQSCTFDFYTYPNSRTNFTFNGTRGISMLGAEYGNSWDIIDYEIKEEHLPEKEISITLEVERKSVGLAAINVIPLMILATLTLVALVLDVKDNIRLFILFFSLLGHFQLLDTINENTPKRGIDVPKILILLRDLIVLTATAIVMTFIFKFLRRKSSRTPLYVTSFNIFFLKSPINKLIWPKWNIETVNEDSIEEMEHWTTFANVFNTLSLVIFFVVYCILFAVYIPRPLPKQY